VRLADTSAWVWTRAVGRELRAEFDEAVIAGEIATCAIVKLELLYSARSPAEFTTLRADLDELHDCPIGAEQMQRALEVYGQLANQGGLHQRSVRQPDLLIATAAEAAGVPVLHYDEDYDRITAITGQPTDWLAPRGSLKPRKRS
jgi:predicted nucleic acid-binding protein